MQPNLTTTGVVGATTGAERVAGGGRVPVPHGTVAANVLVMSVVHPDYLPSLYSLATVLGRTGFEAHIFCFASPARPSPLWSTLNLHVCGEQLGGAASRWRARRRLVATARQWQRDSDPVALVATCPFTLAAALELSGASNIPLIYLSFEAYEVQLRDAIRSPLSWLRSHKGFRDARKATLVCVPSQERAGWLLARAALDRAPVTVLNCPALDTTGSAPDSDSQELVMQLAGRDVVIHTGRVSHAQATLELVESCRYWPSGAGLVVTNVGSSAYEETVRAAAARSERRSDILLLPPVSRSQMLALQQAARIGIFLARETDALETLMPAPNKVGEYLHAGLLTVARRTAFMEALERHGVAVLADSLEPQAIADAVRGALDSFADSDRRGECERVARAWYNMDVQARPIVRLLEAAQRVRTV